MSNRRRQKSKVRAAPLLVEDEAVPAAALSDDLVLAVAQAAVQSQFGSYADFRKRDFTRALARFVATKRIGAERLDETAARLLRAGDETANTLYAAARIAPAD